MLVRMFQPYTSRITCEEMLKHPWVIAGDGDPGEQDEEKEVVAGEEHKEEKAGGVKKENKSCSSTGQDEAP